MQFFANLGQAGADSFIRTALPLDEPARRYLSLVVAAIPANAALPLHVHRNSEDLFVIISGSGHLIESGRKRSIGSLDAVWVPSGHAHGLSTEREAVLEIGCQAPPDDSPVEVPACEDVSPTRQPVIASVKSRGPTRGESSWSSVFPRSHKQALRLFSASLTEAHKLVPPSGASASAIIVVRGAAQIGAHILHALGVAVYAHESPPSVQARENDTLLVAVLAFPEAVCN